ncbi:hypothetical protein L1F30_09470 [Simiduia sp. 21SJ11W-1]|uniref:hypothetical protein n=1 Tax=Simiduia sp. 21SJ11W-1 TaxID=2909669 RepID=UPI00209EC387|nr:hypothetical protein [Simiduia sp. 21SJ11W-1]UTA46402.1 hypothetical protein L1F30_09470 [Simiduia sp. 21SJ11W-1]
MKLPDFADFPPLTLLREKMGASRLGQFEFFDPRLHLTGIERVELAGAGLRVPRVALNKLLDHTVAFKNARVIVWVEGFSDYHLCWCDKFPPDEWVHIGAGNLAERAVCSACLDHLQYEGHNSHRHRHQDYYAQVRRQFDVKDFFARFPHYPVASG